MTTVDDVRNPDFEGPITVDASVEAGCIECGRDVPAGEIVYSKEYLADGATGIRLGVGFCATCIQPHLEALQRRALALKAESDAARAAYAAGSPA